MTVQEAVPGSPGRTSALEVEIAGPDLTDGDRDWAARQVAHLFALDADFTEFLALGRTDLLVAALQAHFPGLRPARTPTVFEALAQAIIGQQISGAVARRIRDLVVERLGEPFVLDGAVYRAYPRPAAFAAASIEDLRALKLSQRKAEYLREIGAAVAEGRLDLEGLRGQPNHEIVARLTALRGVGRWTAEWVRLRALGRLDAFPADDLALDRIVGQFYFGDRSVTKHEALALAERWGSCQGLVTAYLFAAIRQRIDLGRANTPYHR